MRGEADEQTSVKDASMRSTNSTRDLPASMSSPHLERCSRPVIRATVIRADHKGNSNTCRRSRNSQR